MLDALRLLFGSPSWPPFGSARRSMAKGHQRKPRLRDLCVVSSEEPGGTGSITFGFIHPDAVLLQLGSADVSSRVPAC